MQQTWARQREVMLFSGLVSLSLLAWTLQVPEFRVGYDICTDKLDDLYKKLKLKVCLTQRPESAEEEA